MSAMDRANMLKLDEIAEEAGGYVQFFSESERNKVNFDYRAISRYCNEKGIEPIDMTVRELNNFIKET